MKFEVDSNSINESIAKALSSFYRTIFTAQQDEKDY